jgi:hypothetical protein
MAVQLYNCTVLTSIGRDWCRGCLVGCRSLRIDSSSFIGNISNISFIPISLVVNMLGTAIRKSNRVRSSNTASTITCLSSIESSLGEVICNTVGVGVGRSLIRVSWLSISLNNRGVVGRGNLNYWCMVSCGSMDNWSMVSWGSVDNWSMVDWSSVDNGGGMVYWCSMDNRSSMVDRSMDSMDSMGSNWNNSGMSNRHRSVSTNCGLDLRQTLRVVYLSD